MSSAGEDIVHRLYRSLEVGDLEAAAEQVADEVVVSNIATGDEYVGKAGYLEMVRSWRGAIPDLSYEAIHLSVGRRRAVAEFEISGTHTRPFVTPRGHLPPTGMEVVLRFCEVLDLDNDQITGIRSYFDSHSLLRQFGLADGTPLHAPDRRAALDLYAQPIEQHEPQRNKAVVQRFIEDVLNHQNPAAASHSCARNYIWHGGSLGDAHGLPAYQHVLAAFLHAFPDLHLEILDKIAEGDRVAVRFSMTGTHLGEFQGIKPTFKRIRGGGTNTYRFENQRIVEEWWQGDMLMMLQQMDAAPSTVPIGS